eukprot:2562819-Pleurochrysis_carterae.AAC.1
MRTSTTTTMTLKAKTGAAADAGPKAGQHGRVLSRRKRPPLQKSRNCMACPGSSMHVRHEQLSKPAANAVVAKR